MNPADTSTQRPVLETMVADVIDTATGRAHRSDPPLPRTGGPAGNARLTAALGVLLLVLFVVEMATLLSLGRFVGWHIVVGALLVPPSLAKTATTGWRIVRYYTGHRAYVAAGPPPLLLRLLGPLVVAGTLAVLGTGLAVAAMGPEQSYQPLVTVAGQSISALLLHKAAFVIWGAATGVHLVARAVPTIRLLLPTAGATARTPGRTGRALIACATAATMVLAGVAVGGTVAAWGHQQSYEYDQ